MMLFRRDGQNQEEQDGRTIIGGEAADPIMITRTALRPHSRRLSLSLSLTSAPPAIRDRQLGTHPSLCVTLEGSGRRLSVMQRYSTSSRPTVACRRRYHQDYPPPSSPKMTAPIDNTPQRSDADPSHVLPRRERRFSHLMRRQRRSNDTSDGFAVKHPTHTAAHTSLTEFSESRSTSRGGMSVVHPLTCSTVRHGYRATPSPPDGALITT